MLGICLGLQLFMSESYEFGRHEGLNLIAGDVERFELPNLGALNFLLHGSLCGGGTLSLMTDAQGKTFSTALLRMYIDVPEGV